MLGTLTEEKHITKFYNSLSEEKSGEEEVQAVYEVMIART